MTYVFTPFTLPAADAMTQVSKGSLDPGWRKTDADTG